MTKIHFFAGICLLACVFACNKTTKEKRLTTISEPKQETVSAENKPVAAVPQAKAKKNLLQQIVQFFQPEKEENKTIENPILQDSIPIQIAENEPTKPFEMPIVSINNMLASLKDAPKAYSVSANESFTIELPQGTQVYIPQGAFMIEETGEPVNGNALVLAQEYLTTEDIIKANLNTSSTEGMLETGGMLYIEAQYEGKRCALRKDKTIQILFPTKGRAKKEDMQLFSGKRDETDEMQWEAMFPGESSKQDTIRRVALSKMDDFLTFVQNSIEDIKHFSWSKMGKPIVKIKQIRARGGEIPYKQQEVEVPKDYFSLNNFEVKYCDIALEKGRKKGDTIIKFSKKTERLFRFNVGVQTDLATSKLLSPRHLDHFTGIPRPIAYQMARLLRRQKWIPGESEVDFEVFVSSKYKEKMNEKYGKRLIEGDCEENYRTQYGVYVKNYKPVYSYYSPSRMNREYQLRNYVFSSSKLGWINCDRFMSLQNKTDLIAEAGKATDLHAFLIFHNFRAVLSSNLQSYYAAQYGGESEDEQLAYFAGVPMGEKATLLVFKTENQQQFYAIKDLTTSQTPENELDFQPLDKQTLAEITRDLGKRFN